LAEFVRLTQIDDTNVADHFHLALGDMCYFLFEYTSRKGYSFSATNNLISNLKKKPSDSQRPGYHYKGRAIGECVRHLSKGINPNWLAGATIVPVPSSKVAGHPDHDDRMEHICRRLAQNVDVRALVQQRESIVGFHEREQGDRPTIDSLFDLYEIDESLAKPAPTRIGIVDDVLTSGTHFKAMQRVLNQRFPSVPIVGFFIARRVFPEDENPFSVLEAL